MGEYVVTSYTGPAILCAECRRDTKALGHFVSWMLPGASRVTTVCDYMCMAHLLERLLEAKTRA